MYRKTASRETSDSSCGLRARSSGRRTITSATDASTTTAISPTHHAPIDDLLKLWIELTRPLRVRNVPKSASENVSTTSDTFQTRSMPFFSCTITECR